ncbi:hypothetical protein B0H10DRAFT_2208153 [Mycena sp. CBHHK59/15]|nr:hypothetical protein B0H10DRAFT_2208153 [Mycena sp. CBHHK59/15]
MKISIAAIFATLSIFFFPNVALAGLTPADVVKNIGIVTEVSKTIDITLKGLTTSTTPVQVVAISKTIVTQFTTIVSSISTDITAMKATPPFTIEADCLLVVNALNQFVQVHQALLSTVIGKHSIFAQFLVTAPIAAVLRGLEAIIDAFAFSLINLIPCGIASVNTGKNSLDASVMASINLYLQVCTPSVFYPITLPTCH